MSTINTVLDTVLQPYGKAGTGEFRHQENDLSGHEIQKLLDGEDL